jgi:hypothetical protein
MYANGGRDSSYTGGLQGFAQTAIYRLIVRLLISILLLGYTPLAEYPAAHAAGPAAAPSALVAIADLTVGNYTLVATQRFTRTLFDFTYTATLHNAGSTPYSRVVAHLTSLAAATTVIDGIVTFGESVPGTTFRSQDTFTIRQDRTRPFNPADLVWSFEYNRPPVAHAGADRSLPMHSLVQLDGSASSDADGDRLTYHWTLRDRPGGSLAQLDDPAAVQPRFLLDRAGRYVAELVVSDEYADSQPAIVTISTENSAPVAHAGPDQTVPVGTTVPLDGSGSSDSDGDALTYQWSFQRVPVGSVAALSEATAVNPRFDVDRAGIYEVQLRVSDGRLASEIDIVIVSTQNSAPVAKAGADQTVPLGAAVALDGSQSSDADGDRLTYRWALLRVPATSAAELSNPHANAPGFTVDRAGLYVVQLIVNDGQLDSLPDTVTISTENSKPTANTGVDQTVPRGGIVMLDGSASHDADHDPLTYAWTLIKRPPGSTAMLLNAATVQATFIADRAGDYIAQLIVRDATSDSAPDTVVISTENSKPVADAGADQTALISETVVLNGNGSSDPDGDPLTFQWSLLSTPTNSTAALSGVTTPNPSFVPDLIGRYVTQLIVNDGKLNSDPATVRVDAVRRNQSPVITSAPITTATAGQPYGYDVEATDPDAGDPLTFSLTIAPTGMAIEAATGLIGWTPTEAQVGNQPVTVQVQDSGGLSAIQSFSITVARGNRPPAVSNDTYNLTQDETLSIAAPGVLANDSDPDGDSLTAMLVGNLTQGALTLHPDGAFVYTPAAGFIGEDTFTYKANDGQLDSTTATVTIKVNESNKPPVVTSTPNTAQWMQLAPTGTPPVPKYAGSLQTYDEVNDRLIAFGGQDANNRQLNDVWVLSHASGLGGAPAWTKLEPTGTAPSPRALFISAYDATANRLIVYGGCSGICSPVSNAWVLTHANGLGGPSEWLPLPASNPLAYGVGGYEPISNRLVVFGGLTGGRGSDTNDVKVLLDANGIGEPRWVALNPVGAPPPLRGHSQPGVYDLYPTP